MLSGSTYKYDVFISYSRKKDVYQWVHNIFLPVFKLFFNESLSWDPKIFVDVNEIKFGDSWPERLKEAIAYSKCMISIWTPSYFRSEYCIKECGLMMYRETMLGYRKPTTPNGLVFPVNLYDGDFFPVITKEINWFLCHDYFRVAQAFKQSERHLTFQDVMAQKVPDIVHVVQNAPDWNSQWLEDEWLKKAFAYSEENLQIISKPKTKPVLE